MILVLLHNEKKKFKKIFFEVISNSKIFNINFFQRNCQRPSFCQTYKGTKQRGAGQRRIPYTKQLFKVTYLTINNYP